jgi:hypothetical protein
MAPSAAQEPSAVKGRAGGGIPWARVALACAVLAVAGGVRWWQQWRVNAVLETGQVSPFPLKSLPMALGSWRVPEEREEVLEPEIVQFTRCVDYLKRHYVNDQTGVGVDVLILYGPASIAHKPEICYPGIGFQLVDGPHPQMFTVPNGRASFLSLTFAKGEGGLTDRQQVYYALRYGGRWTVDFDFKRMKRLPGLYKIQLSRRVGANERVDRSDPCESFLEAMLPELERRISGSTAASSR